MGNGRGYPRGSGRRRLGAPRNLLALLGLLAVLAVLAAPGAALAGRFSKGGTEFMEDFAGSEFDARYWSLLTTGGVQTTQVDGLIVEVPAEPTMSAFYSHVEAADGFAIKSASDFLMRFSLDCRKWPTPGNGVSAGLYMEVRKKGSRTKSLYQLQFVRESDNVSGQEVYRLSGWDMTGTESRFISKEVVTDATACRFTVRGTPRGSCSEPSRRMS